MLAMFHPAGPGHLKLVMFKRLCFSSQVQRNNWWLLLSHRFATKRGRGHPSTAAVSALREKPKLADQPSKAQASHEIGSDMKSEHIPGVQVRASPDQHIQNRQVLLDRFGSRIPMPNLLSTSDDASGCFNRCHFARKATCFSLPKSSDASLNVRCFHLNLEDRASFQFPLWPC